MEEEQIEKAVLAYLKKKGYRQAEQAFQEEQLKSSQTKTDPDLANQILFQVSVSSRLSFSASPYICFIYPFLSLHSSICLLLC